MNRKFVFDHDLGAVVEVDRPTHIQGVARWPLASEAAGVHPDQIAEAREFNRKSGVRATEFTPDGRPVFTGPGHRREYLRAWKKYDRSGFD